MRCIIQRVSNASVSIGGKVKSSVGRGMMLLLGIETADTADDIEWLCGKIAKLRIFADDNGMMNLPVSEVHGDILLISQFTLFASTQKGNRPSYIRAARPEYAIPLYEKFIEELERQVNKKIFTGEFGADMQIELLNDGPVTIFIDSKNKE